ncbi:MAG TPA: metallophosphoesterase family protein [Amnibacterium sp.]|uniref:metallophosphoesterase family protein n=1 Tax=Amnibacterium sp. TaxID=1872496 RepID=UPI002F942DB3
MVASVAVLSDIHGMLHALDAVLAEPVVRRADLIVVTGDHTWGPQPAGVLDRLAGLGAGAVLVRGNADRELLQMAQGLDIGLGDDPLSVWGAEQLTGAHQRMLESMATSVTLDVDGFGPVLFSHATPRNDEEVVLVDSRVERWAEVFAGVPDDVRTVVAGHTHMPFLRLVDGRLVVNPGSVGLPYGRAGAHWAVLDRGLVSFGRTPLDPDDLIERTAADSRLPHVREWLEEHIRHPAGDLAALEVFGSWDGRPA